MCLIKTFMSLPGHLLSTLYHFFYPPSLQSSYWHLSSQLLPVFPLPIICIYFLLFVLFLLFPSCGLLSPMNADLFSFFCMTTNSLLSLAHLLLLHYMPSWQHPFSAFIAEPEGSGASEGAWAGGVRRSYSHSGANYQQQALYRQCWYEYTEMLTVFFQH